jgi:hypothetical protein
VSARTNEPRRCTCASSADGLSTHRAARHDGTCKHSELTRTVKRFVARVYRRLPGTRGVTVTLDNR